MQRQLLFLAVLLTLPALGIIGYSGVMERRQALSKAAIETQKLADSIAAEQETVVAAAEQLGSVIAELPEVKAGKAARAQKILSDVIRISPHFHDITIVDAQGRYQTSALLTKPTQVDSRRLLERTASSRRFSSGESSFDTIFKTAILTVGYPLSDARGAFSGMIVISLDFNKFVGHLKRYPFPPGSNYIIADYRGVIVNRGAANGQGVGAKIPPAILARMQSGPQTGTEIFTRSIDNDLRIASFHKLTLKEETLPYFYVRAGVSYSTVMAEANRAILINLLILGFFVALAFLLAVVIGKRSIADRVQALEGAARELAAGNLQIRVSDRVAGGELGDLGRTFDEMAHQLSLRDQELHLQAEMLEQEIAERQEAEACLMVERNNLQTIYASAPVGMALLDDQGAIASANDLMLAQIGGCTDEISRFGIGDALKCCQAASTQTGCGTTAVCASCPLHLALVRTIASGASLHDEEIPLICLREGVPKRIWIRFSLGALIIEEERHFLFAFVDITETKAAEESLRAEKEQLAVTLRSIGDGVITTDTEGRVVLMNTVAEELCQWSQEEAAGKPLREIFNIIGEVNRLPLENPVSSVLATGKIVELANHTRLVSRHGVERLIADSAAPILDREQAIIGVVLVFRDTTEKKEIEEELFRARKLESIGVLAGGIAHDFNNYLTAILGNISMAKMQLPPGQSLHAVLNSAENASLRARDLTQQLLTFSKGGAPVVKLASIRQIITDSTEFVLRGSKVRCRYSFAEDLWPVEVDTGQMSQVINNLIINANQAMPDGGEIEIRAGNRELPDLNSLALAPGRYLKIDIVDQGVGIPDSSISRIFDPYFTTKAHGNGLGLATVYSIVKNHLGAIRVQSVPGQGTTFTLYLPASDLTAPLPPTPQDTPRAGQGRILVMDDEELIREVAKGLLELLGYQATTCQDGREAIEACRRAADAGTPFDVVIMDITVPGGMGGQEAVRHLLEWDPQVCAVVSSGYAHDPVMAQFQQYGFKAILAKPYNIAEISGVLAQLAPKAC